MLANTSDFDPKNALPFNELASVDKYMYIKLQKFIKDVKDAYDTFRFGDVYRLVNAYINNTLSSFYLDFTKDILYIMLPSSHERLSCQTVFYEILTSLIKLLSPIIPHTMSEAYQYLSGDKLEDVYLEDMPEAKLGLDDDLEARFDKFMVFRQDVLKALEEARNQKVIGKSFNARLTLTLTPEYISLFKSLNADIAQILIVSQLVVNEGTENKILVTEAEGHVCSRCWMVVDHVDDDELCDRCRDIVKELRHE